LTIIFKLGSNFAYTFNYLFIYLITLILTLLTLNIYYLNQNGDIDIDIERQFSFTYVFGIFFYSYNFWLVFTINCIGIISYVFYTLYLILRFDQTRVRIRSKNISNSMLVYCLRDHNQICAINKRNNYSLSNAIFVLYVVTSINLDIFMYIAMSVNTLELKLTFTFVSFYLFLILFILTYYSAFLSTIAHSPYKRLNKMIIKRAFTIEEKFKILNLIERLGGPDIGVYCADLFPINMFEFYLLVANFSKNFLMIIELFSPK